MSVPGSSGSSPPALIPLAAASSAPPVAAAAAATATLSQIEATQKKLIASKSQQAIEQALLAAAAAAAAGSGGKLAPAAVPVGDEAKSHQAFLQHLVIMREQSEQQQLMFTQQAEMFRQSMERSARQEQLIFQLLSQQAAAAGAEAGGGGGGHGPGPTPYNNNVNSTSTSSPSASISDSASLTNQFRSIKVKSESHSSPRSYSPNTGGGGMGQGLVGRQVKQEFGPIEYVDLTQIDDPHKGSRKEDDGVTKEFAIRKDKIPLPGPSVILKSVHASSFSKFKEDFEGYAKSIGLSAFLTSSLSQLVTDALTSSSKTSRGQLITIITENASKLYSALKQSLGTHFLSFSKAVRQIAMEQIHDTYAHTHVHSSHSGAGSNSMTRAIDQIEYDVYALWSYICEKFSKRTLVDCHRIMTRIQQCQYSPDVDPQRFNESMLEWNDQLDRSEEGTSFNDRQMGHFFLQSLKENLPSQYTTLSTESAGGGITVERVMEVLNNLWDQNAPKREAKFRQRGGGGGGAGAGAGRGGGDPPNGNANYAGTNPLPKNILEKLAKEKACIRFYTSGKCKLGETCRYTHTQRQPTKPSTPPGGAAKPSSPADDETPTESGSASVLIGMEVPVGEAAVAVEGEFNPDTFDLIAANYAMAAGHSVLGPEIFLLDTAASHSICCVKSDLEDVKELSRPIIIAGFTGNMVTVTHSGKIRLNQWMVINNVIHVPGARVNLISASQLYRSQFKLREKWTGNKMECLDVMKGRSKYVSFQHFERSGLFVFARSTLEPKQDKLPPAPTESDNHLARRNLERQQQRPEESKTPHKHSHAQNNKQTDKQPLPASANAAATTTIAPTAAVPTAPTTTTASTTGPTTPIASASACNNLGGNGVGNSTSGSTAGGTIPGSSSGANTGSFSNSKLLTTDDMKAIDLYSQVIHARLGHVGKNTNDCEVCISAKARRHNIAEYSSPDNFKTTSAMDIMVADSTGPVTVKVKDGKSKVKTIRVETSGGNIYSVNLMDVHTHHAWSRLAKHKDQTDIAVKVIDVIKQAQVFTGKKLKRFHCDGGGEFINDTLKTFLADNGTELTFTTAGTPEHNSIIERFNGTQANIHRCLIEQARAPYSLWGEAILTSTYLYNRNHNFNRDGKSCTPYEHWTGQKPDLSNLRIWGCNVFVWIPKQNRGKPQLATWRGIFVGYSDQQRAYRILNPTTGRIEASLNVVFLKKEATFTNCDQLGQRRYQDGDIISLTGTTESDEDDSNSASASDLVDNSDGSDKAQVIQPEPSVDVLTQAQIESRVSAMSDNTWEAGASQYSSGPPTINEIAPRLFNPYTNQQNGIEFTGVDTPLQPELTFYGMPINEDGEYTDNSFRVPTGLSDDEQPENNYLVDKHLREWAVEHEADSRGKGRESLVQSLGIESDSTTINCAWEASWPSIDTKCEFFTAFVVDTNNLPDTGTVFSLVCKNPHPTEPLTHSQAMALPERLHWIAAESDEFKSLVKLGVFKIVNKSSVPKGTIIVPSKIVYKVKYGSNGLPARFKCRVVAKGFKQVFNINYDLTYAPVVRGQSIKMILTLVAHYDLEHLNFDVKTAFLYGELPAKHVVYMSPPDGWTGDKNEMWLLVKTLYGLKQSPREWNAKFHGSLVKLGWNNIISDRCVYIKKSRTGQLMLMYLYVDDTGVAFHNTDRSEWEQDLATLKSEYEIDAVADSGWILNMKVTRDRVKRELYLSQEVHIDQALEHFGLSNCTTTTNPIMVEMIDELLEKDAVPVPCNADKKRLYQSLVGSLLYIANTTRLDICAAVGMLTPHCANPSMHHITAAVGVFRYLRGTRTYSMVFKQAGSNTATVMDGKSELKLKDAVLYAYADSNWGGGAKTDKTLKRRSTTGVIVKLLGNTVSWISKRQATPAKSTTDAEYQALSMCLSEVLWHHKWLKEVLGYQSLTPLFSTSELLFLSDSQSAIALAENEGAHQRSRHIDISHHFISDYVQKKKVKLVWIPTADQQADLLTKKLPDKQFQSLVKLLLTTGTSNN